MSLLIYVECGCGQLSARHAHRHYGHHKRGYRYLRQHPYGHRCDLRYRHYHGDYAYFGTLEAVLLGLVARELVYEVFD